MKSISRLPAVTTYNRTDSTSNRPRQPAGLPAQGRIVNARVIDIRPDNTLLLQIGENRFTARSELSFSPGQNLQLQLLSTTPQIEFRIIGDTLGKLFAHPLTLVGNKIDITALLAAVRQNHALMMQLSATATATLTELASLQQGFSNPVSGQADSGSLLKSLIDGMGLALEKMLAQGEEGRGASTLKAALFELLSHSGHEKGLVEHLQRSLTTLEFFQLAQLQGESGRQYILPLPLPFLQQGFLVVENEGEQNGRDKHSADQEYRFTLYLQLIGLGDLRIDLVRNQKNLLIRFMTENQEKADFIQDYGDQLKETLTETSLVSISCTTGAVEPASELLKRIVPKGDSIFHTTI